MEEEGGVASPVLPGVKDLELNVPFVLSSVLHSSGSKWTTKKDAAGTSHGYQFWVQGERRIPDEGDCVSFCIGAEPEEFCDNFSLLIDYKLRVEENSQHSWRPGRSLGSLLVQYELVGPDSHKTLGGSSSVDPFWLELDHKTLRSKTNSLEGRNLSIKLQVVVREILTGKEENLHEEGPYRDFALLIDDTAFFVNVDYLADMKSSFFENLQSSKRQGVKRTALMNRSIEDLNIFFNAVCTYRKPVVTCRNVDVVLAQATEFKLSKALRACEQYLLNTVTVHPIRKLEYAAEYGLGILGDTVLRSFGIGLNALNSLHDYCIQNGETLSEMHPDVLEALDIHDKYLIL